MGLEDCFIAGLPKFPTLPTKMRPKSKSLVSYRFRRVFGPNNTMVVSASTPHLSQYQEADSNSSMMGAHFGGVERFDQRQKNRQGHGQQDFEDKTPTAESPVRSLRKSLSRLSFLLPAGQEPEEY